jgi:type VI protein secretion system component VasK
MRRDLKEYRWRRQLPGIILTLRLESVGSKQD